MNAHRPRRRLRKPSRGKRESSRHEECRPDDRMRIGQHARCLHRSMDDSIPLQNSRNRGGPTTKDGGGNVIRRRNGPDTDQRLPQLLGTLDRIDFKRRRLLRQKRTDRTVGGKRSEVGLHGRPLEPLRGNSRRRLDVIQMASRIATLRACFRQARIMAPVGMECTTEENGECISPQQEGDRCLVAKAVHANTRNRQGKSKPTLC